DPTLSLGFVANIYAAERQAIVVMPCLTNFGRTLILCNLIRRQADNVWARARRVRDRGRRQICTDVVCKRPIITASDFSILQSLHHIPESRFEYALRCNVAM